VFLSHAVRALVSRFRTDCGTSSAAAPAPAPDPAAAAASLLFLAISGDPTPRHLRARLLSTEAVGVHGSTVPSEGGDRPDSLHISLTNLRVRVSTGGMRGERGIERLEDEHCRK